MRIAQLAPLHEAVPPRCYGGTERVVDWLCRELTARGHEVTLFASGDSRTAARLEPIVRKALRWVGHALEDPVAHHLVAIEQLRARLGEFDLVHSHLDYLPFQALRGVATPVVTTLHGRLDVGGLAGIYRCFQDRPLVSISQSQRRPMPDANWAATIHHGLPLDDYPVGSGNEDYFVFLGRISPEKRPHVAIEAARRAGVRLVIAAKVDLVDQRYFDEVVKPLLMHPRIEFIGEIREEEKPELLGRARALLFPILWPEPFGLAMIESMACGTPVVTRRCGSTPEVVLDGKSGYLCDDDDEIGEAMSRIDRIDRSDCRHWVEDRFSVARMAGDYEALFERLGGESARRSLASLHDDDVNGAFAAAHLNADILPVAHEIEIDGCVSDAEVADTNAFEKRRQDGIAKEETPLRGGDLDAQDRLEERIDRC
jgi:glycosyltransferase involved in cell wall biosynthesis